MNKFIALILFTFPFLLFSQTEVDFTEIDNHAINAPSSARTSVKKLASYLTQNTASELEKTRAIFMWITENIRYDVGTYFGSKISAEEHARRQETKNVLRGRKAVCQGYSMLFDELCAAAGIQSEKVTGYTKNRRNRATRSEHAWNIVRIDGKWFLMDCTWGAGTVNFETRKYKKKRNETYFLADSKDFLENHFPHDPAFQLVAQPITIKDFENNKITSSQTSLIIKNNDQILDKYAALKNRPAKEVDSAKRILKFDPNSAHAKYQLASNYFKQAAEIYEDYRVEKTGFIGKERELTEGALDSWEKKIAAIRRKLNATKPYLNEIKPGTQYFKFGLQVKKNVKEFEKFLRREDGDILKLRKWLASK